MNRPTTSFLAKLACAAAVLAAAGTAHAANYYWVGNSSTSTAFDSNAQVVTSTSYNNWSSSAGNAFSTSSTGTPVGTSAVPLSVDTATFGTAPELAGSTNATYTYSSVGGNNEANRQAAYGLAGSSGALVNLAGGSKSAVSYTFSGGANAANFLFDNGTKGYAGNYVRFYAASANATPTAVITLNSGAGNVTFASDWVGIRSAGQEFVNNSSNALTFGQVVSYANTAPTVAATTSTYNVVVGGTGSGAVNFIGGIADGSTSSTGVANYAKLALVVSNSGIVNMNGLADTAYNSTAQGGTAFQGQYSGGTTVASGRLNVNVSSNALGSGAVSVNGGTLALTVTGVQLGALTIGSGGTLTLNTDNSFSTTALTLGGTLAFSNVDSTAGTYNLWTGATATGNFSSVSGGSGLSWVNSAGTWTAANAGTTYSLVASSGVLTVATVPEPSTVAAVGLGLGVIGLTISRRRRQG